MSRLKILNSVMCEFIAEGTNNKQTLVNIISGDLQISQFPAHIPAAFFVEFSPIESFHAELEISIVLGKKKVGAVNARIDLEKDEISAVALPMGLLKIEAPTVLSLVLTVPESRPLTLLKKNIINMPAAISTTA